MQLCDPRLGKYLRLISLPRRLPLRQELAHLVLNASPVLARVGDYLCLLFIAGLTIVEVVHSEQDGAS